MHLPWGQKVKGWITVKVRVGWVHERAARRDDRAQSARHPRLVPEQALQGQETLDTDEADTAATRQGPPSAFLSLSRDA